MKTYIYSYRRGRQDPNGNPKHWITVYRVKNNKPILLAAMVAIGYRGILQAVCEVIGRIEKWGQRRVKLSPGFPCTGVENAEREDKIRIIQI